MARPICKSSTQICSFLMFEHHKQSNQHFTKRSWVQDGPSFKGQRQIHLLLMYVKNTVTEIWQQLPYVLVLFAAEASCILMHPENPHYPIITRYLLRGPSMDLEVQLLLLCIFSSVWKCHFCFLLLMKDFLGLGSGIFCFLLLLKMDFLGCC